MYTPVYHRYYEQRLIRTSYIVTVVVNAGMMIAFPAGYLKLHSVIGWIFTTIVYTVLTAACCFISYRATALFGVVENKEKHLKNVLDEIQGLSDDLYTAGTALSSVSENESESAEQLDATSEQLVESSNILSSKTDESMGNLSELSEWKDVVATEVGNLANSTKESLTVVQTVIERVQQNVKEITAQVEENSTKIGTQNEYLENVFPCMKGMKGLMDISVSAIEAMAESNASDTANVAVQAGAINQMVDKMTMLLKQDE